MRIEAWSDDRYAAKLQELYFRKHAPTMQVIAETINEEFGTTFSKNAIVSKAHRMGLTNRIIPADRGLAPGRTYSVPRVQRPRVFAEARAKPARESIDIVKLRCVEVIPLHISLVDLESRHCRYPFDGVDGNPVTYCGHPRFTYLRNGIETESSWCGPHHGICLGQGTSSERAATKGIAA